MTKCWRAGQALHFCEAPFLHFDRKPQHPLELSMCPPPPEYADGSDLFTLLHKYGGRLSEKLAVQLVMEPFLRVMHYLHTRAIIHRDIKPENIMFTRNMCLKLGDFGLAIDLREERAVTRAGTLGEYLLPYNPTPLMTL